MFVQSINLLMKTVWGVNNRQWFPYRARTHTYMETIQPFFKVFFALLLRCITQGIGLDLLHHGEQTVGTGGREVVFKADGINEM